MTIETALIASWATFVLALGTLGFCVLFQTGQAPSLRLSALEAKVDLSKVSPRRLDKLRAPLTPGRGGAWNRLVHDQDENRLRSRISALRTQRKILAFSIIVGACLCVAACITMAKIYSDVSRAGYLSKSALEFLGFYLIAIFGWYTIPMLLLGYSATFTALEHRWNGESSRKAPLSHT